LEEAVREAARQGWREVEVISTFVLGDHWTEVYALAGVHREDVARQVRGRVDAAVAEAVQRAAASGGPAPSVTTTVLEGRPDDVLLGLSRDARLLVLGSRGRGALLGALLGSVAFGCVVHAHRPTIVVPARVAARREHRRPAVPS
jgi:nucleotide-binding universal stress UspA family protein